ncbi:MAG: helix-turn-helix domain-containing protein [Acutalibacteraceae bacterium]
MGIDYPIIGQRIQRLRRQRGMTQEQLAEKLGVTVGYISQLERGVTKISLDTLGRICAALRGDMAAILSGASPEQASYRQDELMQKYARLTPAQKQLLLDFVDLLLKHAV